MVDSKEGVDAIEPKEERNVVAPMPPGTTDPMPYTTTIADREKPAPNTKVEGDGEKPSSAGGGGGYIWSS